jgi:CheY-like chemotaxis protein
VRRVLAVDDNPTNLLVARALPESLGCEVVTADSGAQPLDLAVSSDFDLVLMDIQMPLMDGYETLGRPGLKSASTDSSPDLVLSPSSS